MFLCNLALLLDKNRDQFVCQFDSLSRREIDARNSEDSPDDIWNLVCNEYNNPSWVPLTEQFPDMHSMFRVRMSLPLAPGEVPMTPENAKKAIRSLWAQFKNAHSNWSASGNGKDGRALTAGKVIRLNGTVYEPTDADVDEYEDQYVHVDDDRFKFCENQQSQLSLAYFWAAIESLGLTSFCLQNLGHMGLEYGRQPQSARDGWKAAANKRKDTLVTAVADIPKEFQRIMDSDKVFHKHESDKKECRHCESMLRNARIDMNAW